MLPYIRHLGYLGRVFRTMLLFLGKHILKVLNVGLEQCLSSASIDALFITGVLRISVFLQAALCKFLANCSKG